MGFYCFLRSFVVQWPVSVRLRTIRPQATAYIAKIIWYLSAMQLFLQCIRINRKLLLSMLTSAFFFVWSRWITKSAKVKQNAVKQIWREICTQRTVIQGWKKYPKFRFKIWHSLHFSVVNKELSTIMQKIWNESSHPLRRKNFSNFTEIIWHRT